MKIALGLLLGLATTWVVLVVATPRMPPDVERFDGFPYLVTRIGRAPLRHVALLPAGLTREQLLDLARKQVLVDHFGRW